MLNNSNSRDELTPEPRRHILVVDDDPLFRSLMVSVLRKDFDVAVAPDGADGFYLALERVPDLAVLDIQMPGWDGIKTLKAFRSHPLLANVKVVVMTSDASRETVLAAVQGGADDYIIKTAFSRDDFRLKLDCLLRDQLPAATLNETEVNDGPKVPVRDDLEPMLAPVGTGSQPEKLVGWAGSEDILQEAIDAWE